MRRPKILESSQTMQCCVSGTLLLAALIAILIPKFDSATKQWAFGITTAVLGYWFRRR